MKEKPKNFGSQNDLALPAGRLFKFSHDPVILISEMHGKETNENENILKEQLILLKAQVCKVLKDKRSSILRFSYFNVSLK